MSKIKIRSVNAPRTRNDRHEENPGSADSSGNPPGLSEVLISALDERWRKYLRLSRECAKEPGEKSIHDLRVATRRMLAILDLLKTILSKNAGGKIRKRLRAELKALSALRDLQVQIILASEFVGANPALVGFVEELKSRRKSLAGKARREILQADIPLLKKYFNQIRDRLEVFLRDPVAVETTFLVIRGILAGIYVRTVDPRRRISSEPDNRIEDLHYIRVALKRFRYTIEIVKPVFPGITDQLLQEVQNFQVSMGDIQDMQVFIAGIEAFAKKERKRARGRRVTVVDPFRPVVDLLIQSQNERVNDVVTSLDRLDELRRALR